MLAQPIPQEIPEQIRFRILCCAKSEAGYSEAELPSIGMPVHRKVNWIGVRLSHAHPGEGMPVTQEDAISALKQVYDPEIPVNIVDLGLIYDVRFEPAPEDKQDVTVDMTLTAQGCPAHVEIGQQVKSRLESLPGIRNANVNVVWSPPWTPERLSADARKQLGIE